MLMIIHHNMYVLLCLATTNKETAIQVARISLAIGSSLLLVKTGVDYLHAIDKQVVNQSKPKT